jgi:hypothetical protein
VSRHLGSQRFRDRDRRFFNQALGQNSTVGGGSVRTASGDEDWVAGTLFQDF